MPNILSGCFVQGYNKAAKMEKGVKVEMVKDYAAHEQKVLGDLADARTKYAGAATQKEKLEANSQLESALARPEAS